MSKFFGILVLALTPCVSLAQMTPVVLDSAVCASCRINMERMATVDDKDGKFAIGLGITAGVTTDSNIWLASRASPGQIAIYDVNGRHRTTIGRRGEGPGEFMMISRITQLASGRMAVIDPSLRRMTLLLDTAVFASVRLPGTFYDVIELVDGFLVQGPMYTPERMGLSLHVMDNQGTIKRSIGGERNVPSAFVASAPKPFVVYKSEIWIGDRTEYRLERYSQEGRSLQPYVRRPTWFTPWTEPKVGEPASVPPSPALVSMAVDSSGFIWLLFHVADRTWSQSTAPEFVESDKLDRVYDSIIEVLDPSRGQIVQSLRSDLRLLRLLPGVISYSMREEPQGNVVVDFWRLELKGR